MKSIKIKKSQDFSSNSKVFINIGIKKIHIKGFGLYNILLEPGEEIYASHLWTGSRKMRYENITDNSTLLIKPLMGKFFLLFVLFIFSICVCISIFTKSKWSFFPLAPIAVYIALYLTVLKNRYLIIEKDQSEMQ
jgi:hypothetical protein